MIHAVINERDMFSLVSADDPAPKAFDLINFEHSVLTYIIVGLLPFSASAPFSTRAHLNSVCTGKELHAEDDILRAQFLRHYGSLPNSGAKLTFVSPR